MTTVTYHKPGAQTYSEQVLSKLKQPCRYITDSLTFTTQWRAFLHHTTSKRCCIDTETTGLDARSDRLLLVQVYSEEYGSLVIDCRRVHLDLVAQHLNPLLASTEWLKVAHNWAFDYGMLRAKLGCRLERLYDTLVAERLLTIGTQMPCALDEVSLRRLGVIMDKSLRDQFIALGNKMRACETTEEAEALFQAFTIDEYLVSYSDLDVRVLLPIVRQQQPELAKARLVNVAKMEFEALPALVEAYLWGIMVDVERWRAHIAVLQAEAEQVARELETMLQPYIDQYRAQKGQDQAADYEVKLAEWTTIQAQREAVGQLAYDAALEAGQSKGDARKAYFAAKKTIPCPAKPTMPEAGVGVINLKSPEQLGNAMVLAGVPLKMEDGKPRTGNSVLEDLADEHPLAELVLEWRGAQKLVDSFGEAVLRFADDGNRLHPQFNLLGAATGRMSCEKPNIQQVPNNERGAELRKCFIAPPGYKLIASDYSAAELRILAELANEEAAIWAINSGLDLHSMTAFRMFPEVRAGLAEDFVADQSALVDLCFQSVEEIMAQAMVDAQVLARFIELLSLVKKHYPGHRHTAKTINFGTAYGMSYFKLSRDMHIPLDEAKAYIEAYFAANPRITAWLEQTRKQGLQTLQVRTLGGRVRWFHPNAYDPKKQRREFWKVKGAMERQMGNHPVQGTNADWTKTAIGRLRRRFHEGGYDARMLMFIHDEMVVEVHEDQVDAVKALIEEEMIRAGQEMMKRVKVEVASEVGDYWIH